jgi:hypothetical protein
MSAFVDSAVGLSTLCKTTACHVRRSTVCEIHSFLTRRRSIEKADPRSQKKIEGRPKRAQAPPSASAVERSRRLVTGDGFGSPPAPPPRGHGLRPRPREPAPPHLLHRRAGVAVACGTGGRAHDGGLRPSRYSEPSVILCTCSSILCGMAPKGDFCSFGNLEVFQLTEINFRFVSHGSACLSY